MPLLHRVLQTFTALLLFTHTSVASHKIYGVNLGNWLLFEPWMAEQEWKSMGGERCDNCSTCIRSEWYVPHQVSNLVVLSATRALTKAYPDTADRLFQEHWETWFTQDDVDKLQAYGINTVRIPLGFWIVEALVDRKTEFYPRGGLLQLVRSISDGSLK
jgi:glucan endo-1,6-beta-glucosidase